MARNKLKIVDKQRINPYTLTVWKPGFIPHSEEQGTLKIRAPTVAINTTTTDASYASDQSKKTKIIKHPYAAKRNYTQNVLWKSTIFTTLKKSNHTWNVGISDAIV